MFSFKVNQILIFEFIQFFSLKFIKFWYFQLSKLLIFIESLLTQIIFSTLLF